MLDFADSVVFMSNLPHDPAEADALWRKYHSTMNMHYELASLYRAGGSRKEIAKLWLMIDQNEFELRAAGVEL